MSASRTLLESLFAAGDAGDVDSFGRYLHVVVVGSLQDQRGTGQQVAAPAEGHVERPRKVEPNGL